MKLKLIILSLLISFFSFGQVPDTETFDLDTVVSVVNPTTPDLIDCFNDTIPGYMNRTYYADYFAEYMNNLNLLMFRDYGPHNVGPGDILTCIDFGLLYNWYAANDVRKVSSSDDWRVPTETEFSDLITYVGSTIAGGELKITGSEYWGDGNIGATNNYGFSAKGSGIWADDNFSGLLAGAEYWSSTIYEDPFDSLAYRMSLKSYNDDAIIEQNYRWNAYSVKLVSNATGVSDGDTIVYTGNNGYKYKAVAINELYWLVNPLVETKFRNGDMIPWHGASSDTFSVAEMYTNTPVVVAYNNDLTSVLCDSTFTFGNPCEVTIPNDLIAHYKLDDTSGAVIDAIGGFNLTNYNSVRGESGVDGYSFKFTNGSDTYCIGNSPMSSLTEGTISCWIKFPAPTGLSFAISGAGFDEYNKADPSIGVTLQGGVNYVPIVGLHSGVHGTGGDKLTWELDTWHFVTIRFYLDGTDFKSKISINDEIAISYLTDGAGTPRTGLSSKLLFGRTGSASYAGWWYSGWLDDVKIWSRQLSDCEIEALYNSY